MIYTAVFSGSLALKFSIIVLFLKLQIHTKYQFDTTLSYIVVAFFKISNSLVHKLENMSYKTFF